MYGLLLPWEALNAVDLSEGFRGAVSRYLGILATTNGRSDDARHHYDDALKMNETMGALPWLAYTQHDYAQMLLSRNGPGDHERAHDSSNWRSPPTVHSVWTDVLLAGVARLGRGPDAAA